MDLDIESVKSKIRELSSKIKDEERIWESYELEIVKLVIDYSITHNIKIPLIDYELYGKDEKEDRLDESYDYFTPFIESIGEELLTNPRFKIHPET